MQSTYPTQHCECDFCGSRRAVNAKKLAVSQRAAQKSGTQQRNGCNCHCHDGGDGQQHPGNASAFDPEHPSPVNQTALNASRGRNGVPGGNQHTIKNASTRAGGAAGTQGAKGGNAPDNETAEQRQAREAAELDALERLLMYEYKARTRAAMEMEQLKANSTNGPARRPQPLPEGYYGNTVTNYDGGVADGADAAGLNTWGRSGTAGGSGYGRNVSSLHEAYAMAQDCPVTPPVHCHASHRLQHTLDDVRQVTADPVNKANRRALQQLLHQHGMTESPVNDEATAGGVNGNATNNARGGSGESAFGSSLAQIRTNNPHPRGGGLVWVPGASGAAAPSQSSMKDTNVLVVEGSSAGGNAAASSKRPPPLSPSATAAAAVAAEKPAGEKHVTYAA